MSRETEGEDFDGVAFSVRQWTAWAPGLDAPEDWQRWARGESAIGVKGEPRLGAMPAMLRRRAGRLGRLALEAAYGICSAQEVLPAVFCSRHGDTHRTYEMLEAMARGEELSPTAFSLSVHNMVGALFSIAKQSLLPVTAIAGGAESATAGLLEACGLLADGSPEVLLVMYDEPLPEAYASFRDEREFSYAWAWRMAPPGTDTISLTWQTSVEPLPSALRGEPLGLEILRLYLSGANRGAMTCGRHVWHWIRHR